MVRISTTGRLGRNRGIADTGTLSRKNLLMVDDADDQLVENYGYESLQLNAPLADADFDPKNPEYHF
jgi:hypothetical protein